MPKMTTEKIDDDTYHYQTCCGPRYVYRADDRDTGWYWRPCDYDNDVPRDGPYESVELAIEAIDNSPCSCE